LPQFNRQAEVLFASDTDVLLPVITNLRINFRISKTLKKEENSCSVDIYNLSQGSREKIETEADKLTLRAGYGDPGDTTTERDAQGTLVIKERGSRQLPSLFIGDITKRDFTYAPPDTIATYECQRQKRTQGIVSVSFKSGQSISQVLKAVVKTAKIEVRKKFEDFIFKNDRPFSKGYSFMGPVKDALDELVDSLQSEWTYQDGVLKVIPLDETDETKAIVLNATNGMLGVPEKFEDKEKKSSKERPKKGFVVRSLLLSSANPGGTLILTSEKLGIFNHLFKIDSVEHVGDTFGAEWGTRMKVIEQIDTTAAVEAAFA